MSDEEDWDEETCHLYDMDPEDWEAEYPTVVAPEDDEELEAYWADVRSPTRVRTPVPTLVDVRDLPKGEPLGNPIAGSVRDLILARFGDREVDVQIGLYTSEGEVTAEGYARVPSRMRLNQEGVSINAVFFPEVTSNWGVVQTAAIFVDDHALFYLDLANAACLRAGDAMSISEMNASID